MSGIYKSKSRYQKKTSEIQKSLVHRARLRKAYFKMLEKDGQEVPTKPSPSSSIKAKKPETDIDPESDNKDSGDESSGDEPFFEEELAAKVTENSHYSKKSQKNRTENDNENKMRYDDRKQIIKQRKRERKQEQEARRRKREQEKARREELRLKHKKQMRKFTSRGQPVMGSRIDRLLDKIKEQEH